MEQNPSLRVWPFQFFSPVSRNKNKDLPNRFHEFESYDHIGSLIEHG